jgi:hypothetical protein
VRVVIASIRARLALTVALGVLLLPTAACAAQPPLTAAAGDQPTSAPVVITPAQWEPGGPMRTPAGPPVVTVAGKISQSNNGSALRLDTAMLDELGLVQVDVYDPWVRKEIRLRGAWLEDLIEVAEPTSDAQSVHFTALDNYQIDLSLDDVRAGGVLLATRGGDGSPIPIEDGGPTRIVFIGDVPAGASADQWIWNITMIDVR